MSAIAGQQSALIETARPPLGSAGEARLDRRQLWLLAGLIVLGTAIRLWIAFTNYGVVYDTQTAYAVTHLLVTHPLTAYATIRYPYPSGFFPILVICHWIAAGLGAAFWAVWKIPAALGDAALTVLVVWGMGRLGASQRERLIAAGLVALGPIFIIVSGFNGQIDSLSILPALAGVIIWKLGGEERAWQTGVLIGLGAAIKTVPFFMVLAVLPTARSRREAAVLLVSAVAVPLLAVLPFLLAHYHWTMKSLTVYRGVPGLGGLSVLLQPSLAHGWLSGHLPAISSTTWFFAHKQNLIVGIAVLATGAYARWRRMDPVRAACVIWLVVYLANFNWAYQYFVWGPPFFLLAGRWREVAVLQLLVLLPASQIYFQFAAHSLEWLFIPVVVLIWLLLAVALARQLRLAWRLAPAPHGGEPRRFP